MPNASHPFAALLQKRVVVLDGAMGTTLHRLGLTEADYRGERFRNWKGKDLKGAIELLLLTKPEAVERVHEEYLRAGADVIETNTFSATTSGLQEFLFDGKPNNGRKDPEFFEGVVSDVGLRETVREINNTAARMAREAADRVSNETGEQRFVAGALGPLPVTSSLSPDVNDPGFPDPLSETGFPETPETFAPKVLRWVRNGWLNMVGGCCGTTPAHIAAFSKQARELPPRVLPLDARSQSDLGNARVSREIARPNEDYPWGWTQEDEAKSSSRRDTATSTPDTRAPRNTPEGHEEAG